MRTTTTITTITVGTPTHKSCWEDSILRHFVLSVRDLLLLNTFLEKVLFTYSCVIKSVKSFLPFTEILHAAEKKAAVSV